MKSFRLLLGLILLIRCVPLAYGVEIRAIMEKVVARELELRERRAGFEYTVMVNKEKLDEAGNVIQTVTSTNRMKATERETYQVETAQTQSPDVKKASFKQVGDFSHMLDRYEWVMEKEENCMGVLCHVIGFTPKPGLSASSREEKIMNHTSGRVWVSKRDHSVLRNEGQLQQPVSVAWLFAKALKVDFLYSTQRLPNGDFGPSQLVFNYVVQLPFGVLRERQTRVMKDYRASGSVVSQ